MTQSIKGKNSTMLCLAKTVSGKQMLCRGMGEMKTSVNKLDGGARCRKGTTDRLVSTANRAMPFSLLRFHWNLETVKWTWLNVFEIR